MVNLVYFPNLAFFHLVRFYFSATLHDVVRRRTLWLGAVRLVLISPLSCWWNSNPFLCNASFCTMKIYHFRFQTVDHSVLLYIHMSKLSIEIWCLKQLLLGFNFLGGPSASPQILKSVSQMLRLIRSTFVFQS